MNRLEKKTTATLLIAIFMISVFAVAIPIASAATITVDDSGGAMHLTIQEAITAAGSGDTIEVAAGLYTEDLLILAGKDGLELSGATGAKIKGVSATVDEYALGYEGIRVQSDNVKIHGFTIEGATTLTGELSAGIVFEASGLEIYDNDFVLVGAGGGIAIGSTSVDIIGTTDVDGVSIHDNTFSGTPTEDYEAIFINRDVGALTDTITIADNTMSGTVKRGIYSERSKTVITGNTMTSSATVPWSGMSISYWKNLVQDSVTVTGNTISGFREAIRLGTTGDQDLTNVVVQGNTIENNDVGILVRSGADGVVVNDNDILGNTLGVENLDSAMLDAEYNWWGTGNGNEIATMVSENVDYDPWLTRGDNDFPLIAENILPTISFTVTPHGVTFTNVKSGTTSSVETLTLTNTGDEPIHVYAELAEDTEGFYYECLKMTRDLYSGTDVYSGSPKTSDLRLEVPRDRAPGYYTGLLVFWAEEL